MRLPYAAKQLLKEVRAIEPKAMSTPTDTPDGLGVWRSMAFDAATSEWLTPALFACKDPRIVFIKHDDRGLVVTFSSGIDADQIHPFQVAAADRVLRGE